MIYEIKQEVQGGSSFGEKEAYCRKSNQSSSFADLRQVGCGSIIQSVRHPDKERCCEE